MTMEQDIGQKKNFTLALMPWVIAAGALLIYLVTLNHWVSFTSILPVARVSGWTWQPDLYGPLFWLVTCPFRLLPGPAIPLAMNAFAAVCAALTLALLARSVALLPHDRTQQQRDRERHPFALLSLPTAWIPPLLAAVICGLSLTYWENATAASSEIFDLLVFAYVARCVLEFRVDPRDSWLFRAALVCGLGMTNNWAMVGFFPVFLVAVVWVRGIGFFNTRFLARMSLCGVAGLLLYLLLPAVQSRSEIAAVPFWRALAMNLGGQKYTLASMYSFVVGNKQEMLLLALGSFVPLAVLAIRWPSSFGDTSRMGVGLATWSFHVVHGVFLVLCVWSALDAPFSPRNRHLGVPLLTLSYLGALSAGYFAGYFLLLFGKTPKMERFRRPSSFERLLHTGMKGAVWALLILTPVLLLYRNLPQIRVTNGRMYQQFAALLARGLPEKPALVLSDDPRRMALLRAVSAHTEKGKNWVLLDTSSLKWPEYQAYLKKKYGALWPADPPKDRQMLDDVQVLQSVVRAATTNSIYYLHPSFGYYFEVFSVEPHGLSYKLNLYTTNSFLAPPASKELVAENEQFWKDAEEALKPLVAAMGPVNPDAKPGFIDELLARARLYKEPNRDATVLAGFYSRALDYWGVEAQKSGDLAKAASHFQRAQEVNPDNVVARINLTYNQGLRDGKPVAAKISSTAFEDEFAKYRSWDQVIGENGPFDEPSYCFVQGQNFAVNRNLRQAAAHFSRVIALAPDNLQARLWLAQIYLLCGMGNDALGIVREIQAHPDQTGFQPANRTDVLQVETSAHLVKGDVAAAEQAVRKALQQYPEDQEVLDTASRTFMQHGLYTNALITLDQQLKLAPGNTGALVNKGFTCIQLGSFQQAIPLLTRVLELEKTNTVLTSYALLNRAIAYFRTEQYDAAKPDYEALLKDHPKTFQAYYGLAEIAFRKKDTAAAIQNYELYLTNAPPNTEEAQTVRERLKELKAGAR